MKELLGREPDVYSLGRLPPQAAKEDVFNMLETLRKEGHFRVVGASEIKAATLDILHKASWPFLLMSPTTNSVVTRS